MATCVSADAPAGATRPASARCGYQQLASPGTRRRRLRVRPRGSDSGKVRVREFSGQIHRFTDMDLIFAVATRSLHLAAGAVRHVDPIEPPPGLMTALPVEWRPRLTDWIRRLRDTGQRLPIVNGLDTLWTLIETRLHNRFDNVCLSRDGGR
jgi:hypothetical protein